MRPGRQQAGIEEVPLSAITSVQDFGQQCQHDDRSDRDQRDASCFG
jgi:hypothetical protein